MKKKVVLLFILFISSFGVNKNVYAFDLDQEIDYKCSTMDDVEGNYDSMCAYKVTSIKKDGKEQTEEEHLYNAYAYLYYNNSDTLLHWISPFDYNRVTERQNKEYFLYNKNGAVIMQAQEKNDDDGLPSGEFNDKLIYGNYITANSLKGGCPSKIYFYTIHTKYSKYNEKWDNYWYIDKSQVPDIPSELSSHQWETLNEYSLVRECDSHTEPPTVNNCKDLIDEDLRKYIDKAFDIIHIGVPILLLGFIIFDLFTSILSGSDDKIKKARKKIIIRIIVAVAIFFVPTIVDFILNIVNDIWATHFDSCL